VLESVDKLGVSDFSDAALMDDIHESNAELDAQSLNVADSLNDTLDFESELAGFNKDFSDYSPQNPNLLSADINSSTVNDQSSELEEVTFDDANYSNTQIPDLPPLKENAVDLAEISLNFEPVQLEPIQLEPMAVSVGDIPDAFNGDFSNLLKVDLKADPKLVLLSPSQPKNQIVEVEAIKENIAESDDVVTKLELAAAYIDMADKEGALELLAEALKEGSPKQRERAQALIDSLA
jgi:pilus assembly protein FimV